MDLDPDDLPGCAFGSRLFAPFCPLVSEFHHSSWLFWDGEGEEGMMVLLGEKACLGLGADLGGWRMFSVFGLRVDRRAGSGICCFDSCMV